MTVCRSTAQSGGRREGSLRNLKLLTVHGSKRIDIVIR
jgi:hypothetical protein